MALKPVAKKEPEKEASEKKRPEFVVRARQSPDSDFWQNIGAVWPAQLKDGQVGYSMKLHFIPTNWDGSALLLPPKEE